MKLVVDSNRLQSEELRTFLTASTINQAVICDFAGMEAYKGDTLASIYKSMQVLADFPNQVLILKGSAKVCGLSGRRKGLQRRLIDENQTRNFPDFIRALILGKAGNHHIQQQLLDHGQFSQAHFDKMLKDAEAIKPSFDHLTKAYTKEERAIIREDREYTSEMIRKLGKTLIELSGLLFQDSPLVRRTPKFEELPNTFLFRFTLCCYLMVIRKGALGGVADAKPEKIRNDLVDMMFVAYGTYFDGILSNDQNVKRIFIEAAPMIAGLFGGEVSRHSLGHSRHVTWSAGPNQVATNL